MLCLVLFVFWPLSALVPKRRNLGEQPFFGLLAGALTVLVSLVVWGVATRLLEMDPVVYMVRGPVALIFGVFIVLSIFQEAGFTRLKQPLKGAAMTAVAVVLAVAVQVLYGAAAKLIAPGMASGAPTHELELWLSTAMLGVTFPVIVVFCGALGFWPLVRTRSGDRDQAAPHLRTETAPETPTAE